ncbi:MAG: hemolysin family protein [Desulfobacterales bacterium]
MVTGQLLILVLLLMLSGVFSSAETALFSISKTKARHMAKSGLKTFTLIHEMKQNPHKLLTTILIGNNLVNIGASALATSITIQLIPNYAVGMATGIMTLLILVFGEVFPKSIATRNNILISKILIYPIFWMSIVFLPLIFMLNFIPKITGKIKKTPSVTEEELMTFVEVVEEEGEINEQEVELIYNIFELNDTTASEIMTPRADMFVIGVNQKPDLGAILKSGFTRIPVIEEDIDHVIGIVNIKDLFAFYIASGSDIDIRNIMTPPYFVPENKKLDTLLQHFKRRKNHIAIVVDEHGGVSGLITLEDAIEELVGEIVDETDKEEPLIQSAAEDEWIVLGKTEIEEVNDQLKMAIPDSDRYDTFSGFILDYIDRIPNENDEISLEDFRVTVLEKEGNRINKYIVKKTRSAETAVAESKAQG